MGIQFQPVSYTNFNTNLSTAKKSTNDDKKAKIALQVENVACSLTALGILGMGAVLLQKGKLGEFKKFTKKAVSETTEKLQKEASKETSEQIHKEAMEQLAKKKASEEAAQKAQDFYNNKIESALSHKSAKESAEVFIKAQQEEIKTDTNAIKKTTGKIEKVKQNVKNAQSTETIEKQVQAIVEDARKKAQNLAQIAQENPTHKNKMNARRAQNNLVQAELNAKKTLEKAQKLKA